MGTLSSGDPLSKVLHNIKWVKGCASPTSRVQALPNDRPIYLTVDLDYFDPAFVPGTGTPEPGGETFQSFISLCKVLMRKNLVGADVVELAPIIDPTGNSSVFAAAVVRELTLVLSES